MTSKSEQQRLTTKARQQGGVSPDVSVLYGCWAERRLYTGAAFPGFGNCGKMARKGHLTCSHHADREEAAQALRKQLIAEGKQPPWPRPMNV